MSNPSRRTQPLPKDWPRIRRRVLRRDAYICHVCGRPGADQVDHVKPASQGGTDDMSNLAAIHEIPCHQHKTAREANAVNWHAQSKRREEERHPGDRRGGGDPQALKPPTGIASTSQRVRVPLSKPRATDTVALNLGGRHGLQWSHPQTLRRAQATQ